MNLPIVKVDTWKFSMEYEIEMGVLWIIDNPHEKEIYNLCLEHSIHAIYFYKQKNIYQDLLLPIDEITVKFILCDNFTVTINNIARLVIDSCTNSIVKVIGNTYSINLSTNWNLALSVDGLTDTLVIDNYNTIKYLYFKELVNFYTNKSCPIEYFVVKHGFPDIGNTQEIKNSFGIKGSHVPNNLIYVGSNLIDKHNLIVINLRYGDVLKTDIEYDTLSFIFPFNDLIQYMI